MKNSVRLIVTMLCVLAASAFAPAGTFAQEEAGSPATIDSAAVGRKLSSQNPLERRAAAEEPARLASVEHPRLVEGYRVAAKDSRPRRALDSALYRLGNNWSPFALG